jgi:hypothetical protein
MKNQEWHQILAKKSRRKDEITWLNPKKMKGKDGFDLSRSKKGLIQTLMEQRFFLKIRLALALHSSVLFLKRASAVHHFHWPRQS